MTHLLQSSELSLFVVDPHTGEGVDGEPVAAVSVVRLQLRQVGGVARVWLPAHTAHLREIPLGHIVLRQCSPQKNPSPRIFRNISQIMGLLELLGTDLVHKVS